MIWRAFGFASLVMVLAIVPVGAQAPIIGIASVIDAKPSRSTVSAFACSALMRPRAARHMV